MVGRPAHRGVPRPPAEGFTLVEVLIGLMVAMIGLLGTVAIQMTVMNATKAANDATVAQRLAAQVMEQFNVRVTIAAPPPASNDLLAPVANGAWTNPVFLNVNGQPCPQSPACRWRLRTRVTNLGVNLPYNISVEITYAGDTGTPKVVQLDAERRKRW